MSNFFVLGLPRSRTAWLANFLTYNNSFCFHEGINGCRSIPEYKNKLGDSGDSGTGMMLFDMNMLFPDAPKVIIERDPKYAIDFCYRVYGNYDPQAIYRLQDKLDVIDGLRVKYDEIDVYLEGIWNHLIGDGFDQQRADLLTKLQIQVVDPHDIDEQAARELFDGYSL